jgi:hypothetical protein
MLLPRHATALFNPCFDWFGEWRSTKYDWCSTVCRLPARSTFFDGDVRPPLQMYPPRAGCAPGVSPHPPPPPPPKKKKSPSRRKPSPSLSAPLLPLSHLLWPRCPRQRQPQHASHFSLRTYVRTVISVTVHVRTRVQVSHYLKNDLKYNNHSGATKKSVGVVSIKDITVSYGSFQLDSDVCSADLHHSPRKQHVGLQHAHQRLHRLPVRTRVQI